MGTGPPENRFLRESSSQVSLLNFSAGSFDARVRVLNEHDITRISLISPPDKRFRTVTWLLLLGFLFQPVLTYLATPMSVQQPDGIRVAVCTLNGMQREVLIELPSIDSQQQAQDDCPAMELIQLAATAQPAPDFSFPKVVLYAVGLIEQTAGESHHWLHFSAYASRAPPRNFA